MRPQVHLLHESEGVDVSGASVTRKGRQQIALVEQLQLELRPLCGAWINVQIQLDFHVKGGAEQQRPDARISLCTDPGPFIHAHNQHHRHSKKSARPQVHQSSVSFNGAEPAKALISIAYH